MWDEIHFRVREMLASEYITLEEIGDTQTLSAGIPGLFKNISKNSTVWTLLHCPDDGKTKLCYSVVSVTFLFCNSISG